jgi:hypothetical protein
VKICTEVPGSNPGPVKRELFGPHGTPELQTMNLRHQESDTSPWLEFGPRGTPELQTTDECYYQSSYDDPSSYLFVCANPRATRLDQPWVCSKMWFLLWFFATILQKNTYRYINIYILEK